MEAAATAIDPDAVAGELDEYDGETEDEYDEEDED